MKTCQIRIFPSTEENTAVCIALFYLHCLTRSENRLQIVLIARVFHLSFE